MTTILAFVIGLLYTAGLYLVMRRNIVKLLIGLALLSHAANLLIFTASGLTRGRPPIIEKGHQGPVEEVMADPLPQALILTAIVISFAVLAFSVVLVQRAYQTVGTDDLDKMNTTDRQTPLDEAIPEEKNHRAPDSPQNKNPVTTQP